MNKTCSICNNENSDNASVCEMCGAALEADSLCRKPTVTLVSINGPAIELPEDGALIGRGCSLAPNLFDHNWVSETHCRISIDGGDCYIEDIGSDGNGSTNGTFINGDKIPKRTRVKFYHGNTLSIAHLHFDIRVEYPQSHTEEETVVEERLVWVIECPVSGKRFEVEDSDSRIKECDCCVDIMDKKRISKVKPKQVRAI